MKKYRIIIICILLSTFGMAQDKAIQFGVNFQPILTTIATKPEGFFYKSSVFFCIQKDDHFSYSAGIGFANLGNQKQIILDTFNINIKIGSSSAYSYRAGVYNYKYIYFPLNLNYRVNHLKFIGGIHPYLFYQHEGSLSNDYEFYFKPQTSFSKKDIQRLNFTINLGVSYDIPINKSWSISFESSASVFLIPIYKIEQKYTVKQFSLGLTFGIKRLLSLSNKKVKSNAK